MDGDGHLRRLSLGKAAVKGPNETAREFRDLIARDDLGVDAHRPSRVKGEEEDLVGSAEDTPLILLCQCQCGFGLGGQNWVGPHLRVGRLL